MQISVARLQMTLFLPEKRVIMIKKYSVAWQASGGLATSIPGPGVILPFTDPAASGVPLVLALPFIHLLKKKEVLTCDQCKNQHLVFRGTHP